MGRIVDQAKAIGWDMCAELGILVGHICGYCPAMGGRFAAADHPPGAPCPLCEASDPLDPQQWIMAIAGLQLAMEQIGAATDKEAMARRPPHRPQARPSSHLSREKPAPARPRADQA